MSPFRALSEWLEDRTGVCSVLHNSLDAPGRPERWLSRALGAAVGACLVILSATGIVLMTAYAPSPQSAWASVHYVQFVLPRGWVVRGLHYWAAQALLVLAAAHVLQGALAASHRPKREIGWWLTLLVLALALGHAITGGLLPWDQRGWWARVVEGNIIGLAPIVGGWLQRLMAGGPELGALCLARAYTMHVIVLPAVLFAALWARHEIRGGRPSRAGLWLPRPRVEQVAEGIGVSVVVLCVAFALTERFHGAPLDAPADPGSDYPARPEWFLLTLYELRKFFHGTGEFWGTVLLPAGAGIYLALLPWLDRPSRTRGPALLPVVVIFGGALGLGLAAWRHDREDAKYGRMRAKADARAGAAVRLAMGGVPPSGALSMMRLDPELHGHDLFESHCAACHVMGDLGDPKKASATKLDAWATPAWIEAMIHDPDAPEFFGRGPYREEMPSVDVRPAKKAPDEPWTPMVKSDDEKHAVALFLALQGDEPEDPERPVAEQERALGEKIVSERCTSCHLYKGEGDDEGSGLAPELSGYGSIAWTVAQVDNPSTPQTYRTKALDAARKKHMPRFDGDLSPADIDLVARWTRAHARGTVLR